MIGEELGVNVATVPKCVQIHFDQIVHSQENLFDIRCECHRGIV